MEVLDLSAIQLSRLIRSGSISAVDALEATLERVLAVEGRPGALAPDGPQSDDENKVHAFITLTPERARAQAEAVDRKIAAGEDPGPLAGVPFTAKDIFCVQGTPSTAGARILANFVAPYTATPVARLEAAGGVMLGKVNLDEFTYGSSNESSAFQPSPRNPWDLSRVPGGSSGGSAAAVAAGEGHLSLGSDTAGSVRQPAAFCGVVGLKPTYGRVSRYGLIAYGSSLDCPGAVTRDVTDAALMLGAIAGQDPQDGTAVAVPVPDYTAGLEESVRGLRVGLSPDYFRVIYFDAETGELDDQPIDYQIESAMLSVAGFLAQMGADIVENVPMPHTRYGIPVYFVISRVEAASNLHRYDGVKYGYRTAEPVQDLAEMYRKSRAQGFGLQAKLRILMGMYVSAAQYSEQYYERAMKVRTLIRRDFDQAFDRQGRWKLAALLTPTSPTTAFPFGEVYGNSVLMQYADQLTVPANLAGVPGLSIQAGFDREGLPIGAQLLGRDFSEATLLRIGRAYELATASEAWRKKKVEIVSKPF
jgi:aspartyl-tRNA(Asn)/glutamyl-tRNA(Gln) amidotransferase subunit A